MGRFSFNIKELQMLERCRKILDSLMRHIYDDGETPVMEDGTLRVTFPGFFEQEAGTPTYTVELFSIGLGDQNKFVFEDNTLIGALTKLHDQLEDWVQEV